MLIPKQRFQGSMKVAQHYMPRNPGHSASRPALSPGKPIPGVFVHFSTVKSKNATVKERREPSTRPPPTLLSSFASPRSHKMFNDFARVPIPGVGILTHFPFAARHDPPTSLTKGRDHAPFDGIIPLLGID